MTSFADQRSAMDALVDAIVKKRVTDGIALLEKEHGPDWWRKIDLDTLDLSSSSRCVLGQLYDKAEVSPEEAERYAKSTGSGEDADSAAFHFYSGYYDGFVRGIAIIDGPLLAPRGPSMHGFEKDDFFLSELVEASDEQLADFGVTREMVQDASTETGRDEHGRWRRYAAEIDYFDLEAEWVNEIETRKALS